MEPSFTVRRTDGGVLRIEKELAAGEDFYLFISSDRHHDNAHCDQRLEKEHLDEVLDRGAAWWDNGDLFCAMQGRYDPRASHSQTPAELERDDYVDALVEKAAEFYAPYAKNAVGFAKGNHETSINKRGGANLTKRLVRELKLRQPACQAEDMPYQGWLQLKFSWATSHSTSRKIRYTHGYGGGGPVTKDAIQANRQLVFTEDADFLLSGHTHDAWYIPYKRYCLSDQGKPVYRLCHCLKCPGYKDEFQGGDGWSTEKGHPPKPLGAWWIRFCVKGDRLRSQVTLADEGL